MIVFILTVYLVSHMVFRDRGWTREFPREKLVSWHGLPRYPSCGCDGGGGGGGGGRLLPPRSVRMNDITIHPVGMIPSIDRRWTPSYQTVDISFVAFSPSTQSTEITDRIESI